MRIEERIGGVDWGSVEAALWAEGYAVTAPVLTAAECQELVALYADAGRFRSRIEMARYRFGEGDYQYFAHPLPPLVEALRTGAYGSLAAIANRWMAALGDATRFPLDLAALLARCREAGQTRPTPLLLHYEAEGYNCLHQDLYGEVFFPFQLTAFLSRSGIDHEGGEFLLVEQRPRAQSRGEVIVPGQGSLLVFPTRWRPVRGRRGYYRATVRHGISRVRSGTRYTLGIIFHDAR